MMKSKYNIKELDFSHCFLDPRKSNEEILNLQEKHSDFKQDFGEYFEKRRARLFRYIIIAYDKDTPLISKEPKLNERKMQAALLSGIHRKGEFSEDMIKVMEGNSEREDIKNVYRAIVRYMLLKPDPNYISLVTYWQLLAKFNLMALQGGGKQDSTKLVKAIKEVTDNIKRTEQDIFQGNEGSEIRNLISNSMDVQEIEFRPETISRKSDEELEDLKNE